MDSDAHSKLSHLLACGAPQLEAEVVATGASDNPTTLAVRDWARGPKFFCLLLGSAGSGKTVAAIEALLSARMAWDGGKSWAYSPSEARFALASDLARLSYFDLESQRRLGKLERVPWLVLDDIGSELMTPGWASNFGEIINVRNSERRKTLITSNLTVEAFRERYDERVISRIRGNGVVVSSGVQDLRRGAA